MQSGSLQRLELCKETNGHSRVIDITQTAVKDCFVPWNTVSVFALEMIVRFTKKRLIAARLVC